MSQDTLICPNCAARYKRGSLRPGAKVTCKKCSQAFTVAAADEPEAGLFEPANAQAAGGAPAAAAAGSEPAVEPAAATAVEQETEAVGAGAGAAGARRAVPGRSGARPSLRERGAAAPAGKKSRLPLILGVSAVVLGAALVVFLTRGGGEPARKGTPPVVKQPPPPKPKEGKELYDELKAKAAEATAKADKVGLLSAAAKATLAGPGFADNDERRRLREALYDEILALDPDHEETNDLRGLKRYAGADEEWKGKWVTPEKYSEIDLAFIKRKAEADAKAAAEALEKRWDKDAWTRRAKRIADMQEKKMPAGMKLQFVFDRPLVQRPYFLMVEDVPSPDPIGTADAMGPGLTGLRKDFHARYQAILPDPEEVAATKQVVPVLIFQNEESYKIYRLAREKEGEHLPTENLAAAFYTSWSMAPKDYRGMLYVWHKKDTTEKYFHEVVFHEATHQLMHNAGESEVMGRTPWIQEGIAEFMGAYEGNADAGYTFGHVNETRASSIKRICRAYFDTEEDKRDSASSHEYLTPKQLVGFNRERFERLKAILDGRLKGSQRDQNDGVYINHIYAEGWALIHFFNTFENAKYRKPWESYLARELRHEASPEDFATDFGIKNDADWVKLSEEFFSFCHREDP